MFADPQIPAKFQKRIQQLQTHQTVLLSPMSLWEIGMLVQKERISLEMDCLEWVEQAMSDPGFKLTPISPQIAIMSSRLPGIAHADPVDRILIATAFENHAVLVTCDDKILEYGKGQFISVHDPRNYSHE